MPLCEAFSIDIVRHEGRGYSAFLVSESRGDEVFLAPRSLVGTSGYLEIDFIGYLVAEMYWQFSGKLGPSRGLCTCSNLDIEDVSQLVAFKRWQTYASSDVLPSVSSIHGTYLLRPRSKGDIVDLTRSDLLRNTHFFPTSPDTSLVLKVEDELTMFFVQDPSLRTLEYLVNLCKTVEVAVTYSQDHGADLVSMTSMDKSLAALAEALRSSESILLEPPLAKWYDAWMGRFMS